MEISHSGWRWVSFGLGAMSLASEPSSAKLTALCEEVNDVIARTPTPTAVTNHVKQIALKEHILSGKWMIFESSNGDFEAKWSRVKAAVAAGDLGSVAKINVGCSKRVICVYTYSFQDEEDVYRVCKHLQKIGVSPQFWKPDFLTYVGLNSGILKAGWFCPKRAKILKRPKAASRSIIIVY